MSNTTTSVKCNLMVGLIFVATICTAATLSLSFSSLFKLESDHLAVMVVATNVNLIIAIASGLLAAHYSLKFRLAKDVLKSTSHINSNRHVRVGLRFIKVSFSDTVHCQANHKYIDSNHDLYWHSKELPQVKPKRGSSGLWELNMQILENRNFHIENT